MATFEKYKELQILLLSMTNDEKVNQVKEYIDQNNLMKNQKKTLSTIRLISSVSFSHPRLFFNCVELLKKYPTININPNFYYIKYVDHNIKQRLLMMHLLFNLSSHENVLNDDKYAFHKGEAILFPINFFHESDLSYYLKTHDYDTIKRMTDEQIIKYRNNRRSPHPLSQVIYDDNVNLLQFLISKNNFDIDDQYFNSFFEMNDFLENASLLEYSCFYGSINCFKFLLAKSNSYLIDFDRLLNYSISGGNYEIIHIVEREGHFKSYKEETLSYAILYLRNDLIEYIINNYKIQISPIAYINCIYASNYDAMILLNKLDQSNAINEFGSNGSTPIDIASFEGYLDFFKFILHSFKNVDLTIRNSFGKTILHSAAKGKKPDLVKYIVKHDLVDPRILSNSGYTAADFVIFKLKDYDLADLVEDAEIKWNKNDPNKEHENEEEEN